MVPWRAGKLLVWDIVCGHLAPYYIELRSLPGQTAGALMAKAEALKKEKCSALSHTLEFPSVTVESCWVVLFGFPVRVN